MTGRSVEDRLREEYSGISRRALFELDYMKARVHCCLRDVYRASNWNELIEISGRVKSCESTIVKLRRKTEGRVFDQDRPEDYSICHVSDIVGVRVMVFPDRLLTVVDDALRTELEGWRIEHKEAWWKYHADADGVPIECQVVPMLLAKYWEVEHSTLYKADPALWAFTRATELKEASDEIEKRLVKFGRLYSEIIGGQGPPASVV